MGPVPVQITYAVAPPAPVPGMNLHTQSYKVPPRHVATSRCLTMPSLSESHVKRARSLGPGKNLLKTIRQAVFKGPADHAPHARQAALDLINQGWHMH
jgi:hypothetical protein